LLANNSVKSPSLPRPKSTQNIRTLSVLLLSFITGTQMSEQAIPGEMILNSAETAEAAPPTLEALVASHSLMVFRIAYSILRNHHDAEDASQECFLRVLKQKSNLHKVRNCKTWLARIAWTTALDRRGSGCLMVSIDEESVACEIFKAMTDLSPAPDDQLASMQTQQLLQTLIAGLPEDLRLTLELSTVQELNSSEIAEIIKIPESSVRTRLFRARRQLKEKLSIVLEGRQHGSE
jgi:RNA polymerase sigma-70 factor (ECF subfamily)